MQLTKDHIQRQLLLSFLDLIVSNDVSFDGLRLPPVISHFVDFVVVGIISCHEFESIPNRAWFARNGGDDCGLGWMLRLT